MMAFIEDKKRNLKPVGEKPVNERCTGGAYLVHAPMRVREYVQEDLP